MLRIHGLLRGAALEKTEFSIPRLLRVGRKSERHVKGAKEYLAVFLSIYNLFIPPTESTTPLSACGFHLILTHMGGIKEQCIMPHFMQCSSLLASLYHWVLYTSVYVSRGSFKAQSLDW